MLSTPTSIRAKFDGPTWAKDAADTPNPARSSSLDAPDRFFRSCFVANRMTRQQLQSAIKPSSERSLSLARLPDDLHFQALTGQRVFRPVSYLNQGANLAVCGAPGHGLQAKMRRFSAPRQHGGQVAP